MGHVSTEFEAELDRDGIEIDIVVLADGEIDPADPSVGILSSGIGYVTIKSVTNADGAVVDLTWHEAEEIERAAHRQLTKELL